eukprot:Colp12_sorted_trinity150504_noHs@12722
MQTSEQAASCCTSKNQVLRRVSLLLLFLLLSAAAFLLVFFRKDNTLLRYTSVAEVHVQASCLSNLHGEWTRTPVDYVWIKDFRVLYQSYRFLPAPGVCFPTGRQVEQALHKLSNKHIVMVGDSLMRNIANSIIDRIESGPCSTSKYTVPLVDGRIPNAATVQNVKECSSLRFHGHNHGLRVLNRLNITLELRWNPWLVPFDEANCTHQLETVGVGQNGSLGMEYYMPQVVDNCTDLIGVMSRILNNEPNTLLAFTYTALSTTPKATNHTYYLQNELPKFLKKWSNRILFVSHSSLDLVRQFVDIVAQANLPYVYYADIVPPELFYDVWHPAGPVQVVAAEALLVRLAQLSQLT